MANRQSASRHVRRPFAEVVEVATDPHTVLEVISGFGRFDYIGPALTGRGEEWDVFLDIGSINVGGRVLVTRPDARRLTWRSERGTVHSFALEVTEDGDGSRLTLALEFELAGLLVARLSELIGGRIVQRHLVAAAEQLRHHLEFEAGPGPEHPHAHRSGGPDGPNG